MDTYEGPSKEERNYLVGLTDFEKEALRLGLCPDDMKDWQKDIVRKNLEDAKMYKDDPVNHPAHYTDGKIEVIDFIEDKKLGFHLGNAVKYISRAGKKNPEKEIEDLEKAAWYLNRRIEQLKKSQKKVLTYYGYPVDPYISTSAFEPVSSSATSAFKTVSSSATTTKEDKNNG